MANFLKVYELFVRHQNDEDFEKIYCKTLVMTGENDIGSTIEMSQKLNDLIKSVSYTHLTLPTSYAV